MICYEREGVTGSEKQPGGWGTKRRVGKQGLKGNTGKREPKAQVRTTKHLHVHTLETQRGEGCGLGNILYIMKKENEGTSTKGEKPGALAEWKKSSEKGGNVGGGGGGKDITRLSKRGRSEEKKKKAHDAEIRGMAGWVDS